MNWVAIALVAAMSAPAWAAGTANPDFGSSLRVAAREGRVKTIESLLAEGADVNATSEYGRTALMEAAQFNHTRAVQVLLAHGARVNDQDNSNDTALTLASRTCSIHVTSELLRADANVNLSNYQGRTALIQASRSGCNLMVRQLLSVRGVDLNVKDDGGKTALDYAAEQAIVEVGGPAEEIERSLERLGAKSNFLIPANALKKAPHSRGAAHLP
jgi:ankyrin repeat protein